MNVSILIEIDHKNLIKASQLMRLLFINLHVLLLHLNFNQPITWSPFEVNPSFSLNAIIFPLECPVNGNNKNNELLSEQCLKSFVKINQTKQIDAS